MHEAPGVAGARCCRCCMRQGKIWAMAIGGENDGLLVTGGSDALVVVWGDTTQMCAEEAVMCGGGGGRHHADVC
eukprot:354001-Chlamydomonas_euryale.AAC.5